MAAAAISAVSAAAGGYNLTDSADFETLVTGAGNGVTFDYNARDVIVLKNGTANLATVTIKTPQPDVYSGIITLPDDTFTIAAGKTYLHPMLQIFKNTSTGKIIIECDEAIDALIVRPANT
jgi:hypothetical protein